MQNELTALLNDAKASIAKAADPAAVEQLRVQYLGKKGQLTALLKAVVGFTRGTTPRDGQNHQSGETGIAGLTGEAGCLTQ